MVIIIGTISIICLFLVLFFLKNRKTKISLIIITGIISLGSIILAVMNTLFHYGMVPQTKKEITPVYSPATHSLVPLLTYQPLNDDLRIFLYKSTPQGKITNTETRYHVNNRVRQTAKKQAQLVTEHVTWTYRNQFYRNLFNNQHEGDFKETNYLFKIPKNWQVLTVKQSQQLGKELQKMQRDPRQQQLLSTEIKQKIMVAKRQQPQMTAKQQAALTNKLQIQSQQKAINKVINKIKSQK